MKKIILSLIFVAGAFSFSQAQCSTVTSLNENFDKWKDIDKCWKAESGEAMLYIKEGRVVFYSMMNPGENMYVATPKIAAGKYTLTFDISVNNGDATVELYSIGDTTDAKSFTSISKSSEIKDGKKTYTITLKKDVHLGIKAILNGIHQAVYLDNLSLQAVK